MARTALVAGITKYENKPVLEATVPEAERWDELLRQSFGFTTMLLRDGEVTLDAVILTLESLLDTASAEDLIVFVYAGHGDTVSTGGSAGEESLILFDQTLTETRFGTLVNDHYRLGTFTVVLESCYSGGFEPTLVVRMLQRFAAIFGFRQTKFASPSQPRGLQESFNPILRFGDMASVPAQQKRPLIVAACDINEKAAQSPTLPTLPFHMVFSEQAIPFLEQHRTVTHAKFLDDVGQLVEGQHVTMKGDLSRLPNEFFT